MWARAVRGSPVQDGLNLRRLTMLPGVNADGREALGYLSEGHGSSGSEPADACTDGMEATGWVSEREQGADDRAVLAEGAGAEQPRNPAWLVSFASACSQGWEVMGRGRHLGPRCSVPARSSASCPRL